MPQRQVRFYALASWMKGARWRLTAIWLPYSWVSIRRGGYYFTRNSTVSKHGGKVLNNEQPIKDYAENAVLRFGDLVISIPTRSVQAAGRSVPLTAKEFDLLVTLASAPEHAFNRTALLKQVWNYSYLGKSRTIDVHIATLRRKLEKFTGASCSIQTVWGVGYRFRFHPPVKRHALSGS
jgi:DNA-binding response OmpR family regulator